MCASIRTHVAVDLKVIQANAQAIKTFSGSRLIAVVKADAYGHGVIPIAETLSPFADMFAVATVEEGIELRQVGISQPILILFSPAPDLAEDIVINQLTTAIDNWDLAIRLNTLLEKPDLQVKHTDKGTIRIHVDVNTGMNRSGVRYTEVCDFLQRLETLPNLEVEGIFTHFATADEVDKSFAYLQLKRFSDLLTKTPKILIRHTANSAATLAIPESHFDAVRPGLSLYGVYPGQEKPISLQPALTWKTHVSWIDFIDTGEGVSYGLTYNAKHRTRIAGLRIGYGDGYPRALSGNGEVLIGGMRRPILGHVCMDMMVVKLESSDKVTVGTEVILLGKQGEQEICIDEIAEKSDTISYEILTRIGKRVKRVYIS